MFEVSRRLQKLRDTGDHISANISRDLRMAGLQAGHWRKRAHACASRAISEWPGCKPAIGESEHMHAHLARSQRGREYGRGVQSPLD